MQFSNLLRLALLSAAVCPSARAQCTTTVTGGLIANETWTASQSPICVTSSIQVALLTIEPGVEIRCSPGVEIEVIGLLYADGTPSDPIRMTSASDTTRWTGVRFQNTQDGSNLSHVWIERAETAGLRIIDSYPTIEGCVFYDNTTTGSGAGANVNITGGALAFVDCAFAANKAQAHGGGMRTSVSGTASLLLDRCKFVSNRANTDNVVANRVGGAIYATGPVTSQNCLFAGNSARGRTASFFGTALARGGAVYADAGEQAFNNCSFRNNFVYASENVSGGGESIQSYGGALYLHAGSMSVTNCTLGCNETNGAGNGDTPVRRGAGIFVNGGTLTVENSTIARNSSHGIYVAGGTAAARNSILYFNNSDTSQFAGNLAIEWSDIQNDPTDGSNDNFDVNPIFAGVGCEACDLRIAFPSVCIDRGDDNPIYDDGTLPPGLGTARNDCGAHGGPGNSMWVENALGGWIYYCSVNDNSTGNPGRIDATGSTSVSSNDLILQATDCVPNQPGIFYYGCTQAQIPFGDGFRCITGTVYRLYPATYTDAAGTATRPLDMNSLPPNGAIQPGDIFCFQYWYRDPASSGSTFNLTNAIEVFFQP